MDDSKHSSAKREKGSSAVVLRLAPGSILEDEHEDDDSSKSNRQKRLLSAKQPNETYNKSTIDGKLKQASFGPMSAPAQDETCRNNGVLGDNLDECVPSRQGLLPCLLAKEGRNDGGQYTTGRTITNGMPSERRRQVPPFLLAKGPTREPSQYTTLEEEEEEERAPELEVLTRWERLSEPGAFAIVPTTTAAAADVESSSSDSERDEESAQPDTDNDETLVTAIKVSSPGDDVDVDEAVRIAREEAEQLRQQVKTLQEERQSNKDTIVVATAMLDDENMNASKHGKGGKAMIKMGSTCLWIAVIVFVGCIVGGAIIGIIHATQQEPSVAPTFVTAFPTPAPTLFPCLEEIFIDANDDMETNNTITLQLCQGDCNKDDDCAEGLICFHRNGEYAPVPGCSCWEKDDTRNDYCIEPQTDPCLVETNDYPLGLCEGNCESDFDCQEGFVCHDSSSPSSSSERPDVPFEVPGCRWCPQDNHHDDSFSNATMATNNTINATFSTASTTSKFCVKMSDECDGCGFDAPFDAIAVQSGGFALHMQYSVMLLSLCITIFACW